MEVLVSNLVVNAVQHSPEGATVCVTLKRQEHNDKRALLEITDHGHGIVAEQLPHVFERFFRADSSRSRGTGGAGLGLAISKTIVEGAGGTIALVSEPDRGTTVRCCFGLL